MKWEPLGITFREDRMAPFPTLLAAERVLGMFKILGHTTITIVDGKSVTKWTDVFFFLFGVSSGILIAIMSVINREHISNFNSNIADIGNFSTYLASIMIAMITMICGFICRHNTWDMLIVLADAETKVQRIWGKSIVSISNLLFQFAKIGFNVDYTFLTRLLVGLISAVMMLNFPLGAAVYFLDRSILKVCLYFYSSM